MFHNLLHIKRTNFTNRLNPRKSSFYSFFSPLNINITSNPWCYEPFGKVLVILNINLSWFGLFRFEKRNA